MERSLSYEIKYKKGMSWAAIAMVSVAAHSARMQRQREEEAQKDAERRADKQEKIQKKAILEERSMNQRMAQSSQSLTGGSGGTSPETQPFNKTYIAIAVIGVFVSIIALRR